MAGCRRFRCLAPVILGMVVLLTVVPTFGVGSTYSPGVLAGQWARYGQISASWYSINSTLYPVPSRIRDLQSVNSTTIAVQSVQGPYITASRMRVYANGTSLSDSLWGDVDTGEGNLTDWILAGNLTAGDETYPGSGQSFNSSVPETYLGEARIVNVLRTTQSYPALSGTLNVQLDAVWDRISGVLLKIHFAVAIVSGTVTIAYGNSDTVIVGGNLPDFKITADPLQASVAPQSSSSSIITLVSVDGFSGNVTLLVGNTFCSAVGCPHLRLTQLSVSIAPGGTAMSTLTFTALTPATYDIVVNATSQGITRSVTVEFTVEAPPPPDFLLTATDSLSIQAGKSNIATLTITPENGFTSQVNLTITASNGITATLARNSITGSGTTDLMVTTANDLAPSIYTVTVTATGGSQTHRRTITVAVIVPPTKSSAASSLILGFDPTLFYSVISAIVAAVVFGVFLSGRMKRRPKTTQEASAKPSRFHTLGENKN